MKLPFLPARNERGMSLIELLVSIGMFSVLFTAIVSSYTVAARRSYDDQLITRTNEQARMVLDTISYDVRMAGAGMPLGQSGFAVGGTGLGDAPLAVLTSSTASTIVFRLNEIGRDTILTGSFAPTSTSRTFSAASAADLEDGDIVYISDAMEGGSQGLRGVVESVSGTSVTIATGYVTGVGSVTFVAGSTVSRISDVTYSNATGGITRNNGSSTVVVAPRSTVSFRYFDASGTELTLPLTGSVVDDTLTGVEVTVTVNAAAPLRDGTNYSSTARQRVALRNLIFNR